MYYKGNYLGITRLIDENGKTKHIWCSDKNKFDKLWIMDGHLFIIDFLKELFKIYKIDYIDFGMILFIKNKDKKKVFEIINDFFNYNHLLYDMKNDVFKYVESICFLDFCSKKFLYKMFIEGDLK